MLHVGQDDRGAGTGPHRAVDRGVDRLGAPGGEHHLARARAEQGGNRVAGVLDDGAHQAPFGVDPAGVGRLVPFEPGPHGADHLGTRR